LDVLRREQTLRTKLPLLVLDDRASESANYSPSSETFEDSDGRITDDRLRLIFTCCHPALAREAQVALTLRLLCGLSTAEIAGAFLVSESTMAARVTRAKKKISAARIPYRVPQAHELPERLDAVLTVLHLLYTTGHTAPAGDSHIRLDLTGRAIELSRLTYELMPDEREAAGLLALMVLTEARGPARVDAAGDLVLLAEQNRDDWDRAAIAAGRDLVVVALSGGRPGRFALQAAIAAVHSDAATYETTDWPQIVALYDVLMRVWPSPVVALNRAVALSVLDGPAAGLDALAGLAGDLAGYHYLPAVRGDLLRQLGRADEAISEYRIALTMTDNTTEQRFLQRRIDELS
jgi:RNA polymerase sigma-70 factor (ECF subfamily)